jgi:hypothetical protein
MEDVCIARFIAFEIVACIDVIDILAHEYLFEALAPFVIVRERIFFP